MDLLGHLTFDSRGRGRPELAELYGLPVVRSRVDPVGWLGERRLRRAGRGLERQGVVRTLAPGGFERWDLLEAYGLAPVDPVPFLRGQSAPLALGMLERQGDIPDRSTVALRGLRADRDMVRAAVRLCPKVRNLVISAPRGGAELAGWLRREFGVPILPAGEMAQVALHFQPGMEDGGEPKLELFGPSPELNGLSLEAPRLAEEDKCDILLLSALWEGGLLEEKELKIT